MSTRVGSSSPCRGGMSTRLCDFILALTAGLFVLEASKRVAHQLVVGNPGLRRFLLALPRRGDGLAPSHDEGSQRRLQPQLSAGAADVALLCKLQLECAGADLHGHPDRARLDPLDLLMRLVGPAGARLLGCACRRGVFEAIVLRNLADRDRGGGLCGVHLRRKECKPRG